MFPITELLPQVFYSFISILGQPFMWIFMGVVALLYRKMEAASRYLFPVPKQSFWRLFLLAVFSGIIGGFLGSLLLILVGISVNKIGGLYLLITALGLMLIEQRFLCFAYAGGVLSLLHLLFGFPQELSVPQVMALVAVLHLVEALLIYLTGSLYSLPVYICHRDNRIIGGFNLQKFWPLPLVVMFAGIYPDPGVVQGLIEMPDWWPLIQPELSGPGGDGGELVYSMLAIPAVLGYGDTATNMTPREKTRRSAEELAVFSVLLLFIAIAAGRVSSLAYVAALFGPLGHEAIIYVGRRREARGKPLYVPAAAGLRLLHVWPGSPLARAGIKSGDLILAGNGLSVYDERDLQEALMVTLESSASVESPGRKKRGKAGWSLELEYLAAEDVAGDAAVRDAAEAVVAGPRRKATVQLRDGEGLGYVPVPSRDTGRCLFVSTSGGFLKRWWKKITH